MSPKANRLGQTLESKRQDDIRVRVRLLIRRRNRLYWWHRNGYVLGGSVIAVLAWTKAIPALVLSSLLIGVIHLVLTRQGVTAVAELEEWGYTDKDQEPD